MAKIMADKQNKPEESTVNVSPSVRSDRSDHMDKLDRIESMAGPLEYSVVGSADRMPPTQLYPQPAKVSVEDVYSGVESAEEGYSESENELPPSGRVSVLESDTMDTFDPLTRPLPRGDSDDDTEGVVDETPDKKGVLEPPSVDQDNSRVFRITNDDGSTSLVTPGSQEWKVLVMAVPFPELQRWIAERSNAQALPIVEEGSVQKILFDSQVSLPSEK